MLPLADDVWQLPLAPRNAINAYLIGVTAFARAGKLTGSRFARYAAEFMGAEAVHRALALQSLGKLGNDRVFMRFGGREEAPGLPTTGSNGFYDIRQAVAQLEAAGATVTVK